MKDDYFKLIRYSEGNNTVIVKTECVQLNSILDTFKLFLLASGFVIDGDIVVQKNEEDKNISYFSASGSSGPIIDGKITVHKVEERYE